MLMRALMYIILTRFGLMIVILEEEIMVSGLKPQLVVTFKILNLLIAA